VTDRHLLRIDQALKSDRAAMAAACNFHALREPCERERIVRARSRGVRRDRGRSRLERKR
jgi:hypothetical protein